MASYRIHPEDKIRERLAAKMRREYPDFFFYARFDQAKVSQAKRSRFYTEGIVSGLPDWEIVTPNGYFSGLVLELKETGKGPFSHMRNKKCFRIDNQNELGLPTKEAEHLLEQAYILDKYWESNRAAFFAEGFDQAWSIVEDYIRGGSFKGLKMYEFSYAEKYKLPVIRSIPFNPIKI